MNETLELFKPINEPDKSQNDSKKRSKFKSIDTRKQMRNVELRNKFICDLNNLRIVFRRNTRRSATEASCIVGNMKAFLQS